MVILVLNMFVRLVLVHLVPINTIRNLLLKLEIECCYVVRHDTSQPCQSRIRHDAVQLRYMTKPSLDREVGTMYRPNMAQNYNHTMQCQVAYYHSYARSDRMVRLDILTQCIEHMISL